jgi:hypothetical protein
MKYVQHPEYVQYMNDLFVLNVLWVLAFIFAVVIPYLQR